jgi:NAD(P) transhydrogenase subunit alpha
MPLLMRIGIPLETVPGESRVAVVPETAARLKKLGFDFVVQSGAGLRASHPDEAYTKVGAQVVPTAREAYATDVVLKVQPPRHDDALGGHEIDLIPEGGVLIAFLNGGRDEDVVRRLAARRVTAFAMELIPRTSRAQKMDALSSMSTAAGYKAALMAANSLGRFFPLFMTAAGTLTPARVFVLGAGVAGLQAIATSRRLGAVVEAFDVRPAVREEVMSLGATFVSLDLTHESQQDKGGYAKQLSEEEQQKERDLIAEHVIASDVVITTANVPGRRAPTLITRATVEKMRAGSVIVDLAAESGGNCELTEPGREIRHHDVIVHGPLNLASSLPAHASQMYSRNVSALLQHLVKGGKLALDFSDDIVHDTCISGQDGAFIQGAQTVPS